MVGLGFRVDEGSIILQDTKWVNFNGNAVHQSSAPWCMPDVF